MRGVWVQESRCYLIRHEMYLYLPLLLLLPWNIVNPGKRMADPQEEEGNTPRNLMSRYMSPAGVKVSRVHCRPQWHCGMGMRSLGLCITYTHESRPHYKHTLV